jgi:hypothetical protein
MFTLPIAQAQIHIGISVGFAPPVLPVYAQPPIPGDGYIWTPGYWGYGDAGYFWVPGAWVEAPQPDLLWTPGYWGFVDGAYVWNEGYWGPEVGFYGGVNYGFGYGGIGFFGGEWRGGHFFYNGAVANFGGWHPVNVYIDRDVVIHNTIANPGHASFNGPGGIDRQPSAQERQFANQRHVQPTANQMSHQTAASQDRSQLSSVNHGRPGTVATSSVNSYHQVAQQHAASQPISSTDRDAGRSPNSSMTRSTEGADRGTPEGATRTDSAPRSQAAPKEQPAPKAAPKSKPSKKQG